MPSPFTPEQVSRLHDDARRLADRAREHEQHMDVLVRAAEANAMHAASDLSQAAAAPVNTDALRQAVAAQVKRQFETVESARRACVSAHEQSVGARRILHRFDVVVEAGAAANGGTTSTARRSAAVLVVDDVEDVREMVALVLRDAGFVVRTAANGLEALIAAHEMQPAVILMDMSMPVLDGIEATRLIKATDSTCLAKVIAYTANPPASSVLQQLFVAVVRKPATPDVVLAAVQSAASR